MEGVGRRSFWSLPEAELPEGEALRSFADEIGLSPICAKLLFARGYRTKEAVRCFLSLEDTVFHSPFLLRDVREAVARIRRAVDAREKIAIYGDYDVDGVTSVSLLYLYLREKGADVTYYIPSRSGEGYGVCTAAIDRLADAGVTLIVTVDTGITAVKETVYAAARGVDMVITDHHECCDTLPPAVAVVNPHRPDCRYPFRDLAGVGVIFKVVCAIEATAAIERGGEEIDGVRLVTRRYADLVTIGTIADVMPIVDENRLIVSLGLKAIETTERIGLAALIEEASAGHRAEGEKSPAKKKKITSSFVSFGLAPRINAAGRMSDASHAVELLLSEDADEARTLAETLCEINRERQAEENRIAEEAYRRVEEDVDLENTRVLVLEDDHWKQGVIGIVASRVAERFGRPAILVSFDGAVTGFDSPDDVGKGSGRSLKGMNLFAALADAGDLLVKYGGHELAAGLSLRRGDLPAFRRRINEYAARVLPEGEPITTIAADLELDILDVTLPLAEELEKLEPFGVGNPVPQFILRDLRIERVTELGGGKHLKLQLAAGDVSICAMLFSTPRSRFAFDAGDRIDVLGNIDVNEFRGTRSVQFVVRDFAPSARYDDEFSAMRERYLAVRAGGSFDASEGFLPDRADFAQVYTVLRREFRLGRDVFTERSLYTLVNVGAPRPIPYTRMKYILDIFRELRICGVEEPSEGVYRFDIYFTTSRANIEKSQILKKLKSQCNFSK